MGRRGGWVVPTRRRPHTSYDRMTFTWFRQVKMKNSRDTRSAKPRLEIPDFRMILMATWGRAPSACDAGEPQQRAHTIAAHTSSPVALLTPRTTEPNEPCPSSAPSVYWPSVCGAAMAVTRGASVQMGKTARCRLGGYWRMKPLHHRKSDPLTTPTRAVARTCYATSCVCVTVRVHA